LVFTGRKTLTKLRLPRGQYEGEDLKRAQRQQIGCPESHVFLKQCYRKPGKGADVDHTISH